MSVHLIRVIKGESDKQFVIYGLQAKRSKIDIMDISVSVREEEQMCKRK